MSKHFRPDPLAIPVEQIHNIIAKANALLAKPSRGGVEWLGLLCALDVVLSNDVLTDAIEELESDLGFDDEPEYHFVRAAGEGVDGDLVEVRSSWGMGR